MIDYSKCPSIEEISCYDKPIVCVYFLSNQKGAIKIGQTKNLKKRLKNLNTDSCCNLLLVAKINCPKEYLKDVEAICHRAYSDFRVRNEWFEEIPILEDLSNEQGYLVNAFKNYEKLAAENQVIRKKHKKLGGLKNESN